MTSPKQSATAAGPNANRRRAAKRATAANEEMSFELYNLALDLGEKTDLKDKEPARVKEMQDYLMKMVADAVPLPSGAEGSDE